MKKIGLLSDLHLEASNIGELKNPGWDYLVIAGDLSTNLELTNRFFSYKAPQDIPIIYIMGNHEFEGRRMKDTFDMMKEKLYSFEHVNLLYNESVIIDDIKFIGSTLWTDFESGGIAQKEENMKWAKNNIADFTWIFTEKEDGRHTSMTPEEMVVMSEECTKFLDYELRKNPFEGEKVVVTHFAPHKNSINPKFSHMNCTYWIKNMEDLMGFSKYWLHGHTHNSFNYNVEGTNVVCNPRGYSKIMDLSSNPEFNRDLMLPIGQSLTNKHKNK